MELGSPDNFDPGGGIVNPEKQRFLTELFLSPFGRLALELNQTVLDLVERPDDAALKIRRDDLVEAIHAYPLETYQSEKDAPVDLWG